MISVLVIDDDEVVRETLAVFFDTLGYRAYAAATAAEGRQAASVHAPDLVLVDIRLPDATGLALLSALCADDPELGVIMLTGRADIPAAIQSLHSGAIDFLEKPIDLESLELVVRRAAELVRLRREVLFFRSSSWEGELPASTEKLIGEASENSDVPILIAGEQGTGKEFLARRIHDRSRRSSQPFVRMKVASSGADRFESALFGRERGVVAASTAAHRGLLEIAGSGTVFLKEVGDIPLLSQSKVVRAIDGGVFCRSGGSVDLDTDARFLASTSQSLGELVAKGAFDAALYHRLQLVTVTLLPLRERMGDLARLAVQFLSAGVELSPGALRALQRYSWPGNVRELQNTLWRAELLSGGRPIEVRDLGLPRTVTGETDAPKSLAELEKRAIVNALKATNGNKVRAAALLGIARSTLQEKLKVRRPD